MPRPNVEQSDIDGVVQGTKLFFSCVVPAAAVLGVLAYVVLDFLF